MGNPRRERQAIERAGQFLSKRGPDARRVWRAPDGRVEIFFARLAIVDPDSRAAQPFSDEASGLTVAMNGEIYNYEEIRRELGDYPFRTESDTEVLLATVARWGLPGLKRLRGMFACVIVDLRTRRVYLVRDPIGKKPLFVARWEDGIYFGSSVLAMGAITTAALGIDRGVVEPFWKNGYVPPDRSVLTDCKPLAPGCVMELSWSGEERAQHGCVPSMAIEPPETQEEANQRVAELLRCAVMRRMHNNSSPVSLLSGGIDSTVITNEMSELGRGEAITLGGPSVLTPDRRYAHFAANRIGVPLRVVVPRLKRVEEEVAWAMGLQDEPLGMISFFPLAMLIRAAKEFGKVLLTGDGGDEVFLGYGRATDWIRPENREEQSTEASNPYNVGPPPPSWMSAWGRSVVRHSLLGHMLTKLDRASAEQGVETRCPLLDWDLVTLARATKPEQLLFNKTLKALLKARLAGWPGWFVDRPKIGFTYRLRWFWGARRYRGLREMVSTTSIDTFAEGLPAPLCRPPSRWRTVDIFRNFPAAWKLAAWSHFEQRLSQTILHGSSPSAARGN